MTLPWTFVNLTQPSLGQTPKQPALKPYSPPKPPKPKPVAYVSSPRNGSWQHLQATVIELQKVGFAVICPALIKLDTEMETEDYLDVCKALRERADIMLFDRGWSISPSGYADIQWANSEPGMPYRFLPLTNPQEALELAMEFAEKCFHSNEDLNTKIEELEAKIEELEAEKSQLKQSIKDRINLLHHDVNYLEVLLT